MAALDEGHPAVLRCCRALVAGRAISGLGVGAGAIIVPAYLAEVAPAAHRGAVVQVRVWVGERRWVGGWVGRALLVAVSWRC